MSWKSILAAIAALGLALPAMADWDPSDGHKMHYPQLPDPVGWDVNVTFPMTLADDWRCSASGPVTDIHFWGSWQGGQPGVIQSINLTIFSDIPDPDGEGSAYSMPGQWLWERTVTPVIAAPIDPPGLQGWFDPSIPLVIQNDHVPYFQYNIFFDPRDPTLFVQEQGKIYWLAISVTLGPNSPLFGWKTSRSDHFGDDAVWSGPGTIVWQELRDPIAGQDGTFRSLDLAFVITPEPSQYALVVGLGLVAFAGCRRFRAK